MIHVDINKLTLSPEWKKCAKHLTHQLKALPPNKRSEFIEKNREKTWGAIEVRNALRSIVGDKCWYSEVSLVGADPNVDHFRPKGRVREVDIDLQDMKKTSAGYWWLAFECRNFRLSSMHANQRRVDTKTNGGKWDYFPVRSSRAPEGTPLLLIEEDILALDPCSASDVTLLWFEPDGNPGYAKGKKRLPNALDQQRVRATIWLYHLDKQEIVLKRSGHMREIHTYLALADAQYQLWNRDPARPDLQAKRSFDHWIDQIKSKLSDTAEFAGAKRYAVRSAITDYEWIEEFGLV